MKAPAFLGVAFGIVRSAGSMVAKTLFRGVARGRTVLHRFRPAASPAMPDEQGDRRDRRLVILAATAAVVTLVLLILVVAMARTAREAPPEVIKTGRSLPYDFPSSGSRLLEELIMPGPAVGELPFPLAREPKSRYTDIDAVEARPDLGSLDLSEFTRNRKAELEALYEAVD
ncbi:MAG: hypothetical protein E4H20_06485 [Spirochaetales bacterium]|nr:MAG: hypothetical protein E4H20_06485 [Spirochaetales bacterium]